MFGVRYMVRGLKGLASALGALALCIMCVSPTVSAETVSSERLSAYVSTEPSPGEDLIVEGGPKLHATLEQSVHWGPYGKDHVTLDANEGDTVDGALVTAGYHLTYRVRLTNYGDADATNVSLVARLPYVTNRDKEGMPVYESPFSLGIKDNLVGGVLPAGVTENSNFVDGSTFLVERLSLGAGDTMEYEITADINDNFEYDDYLRVRAMAEAYCDETDGVATSNQLPCTLMRDWSRGNGDVTVNVTQALDSSEVHVYQSYPLDYDADNTRILYKVDVTYNGGDDVTLYGFNIELDGLREIYRDGKHTNLVTDGNTAVYEKDGTSTEEFELPVTLNAENPSATFEFWAPVPQDGEGWPDRVGAKFEANAFSGTEGVGYNSLDIDPVTLVANYDQSLHLQVAIGNETIGEGAVLHKGDVITFTGYFIGPNLNYKDTPPKASPSPKPTPMPIIGAADIHLFHEDMSGNLELIGNTNQISITEMGKKAKYSFSVPFKVTDNNVCVSSLKLGYSVSGRNEYLSKTAFDYERVSDVMSFDVCRGELGLEIEQPGTKLHAGDDVAYKLTLSSACGHSFKQAKAVLAVVPDGMTVYESSVAPEGTVLSVKGGGQKVLWMLDEAPSKSQEYTFTAKTAEDSVGQTTHHVLGAVGVLGVGTELDKGLEKTVDTVVDPMASNLRIDLYRKLYNEDDYSDADKVCLKSIADKGIDFKVSVSNEGPGTARNVVVTSALPSGFKLENGSTEFRQTVDAIPVGETRELTFKAVTDGTFNKTYESSASAEWAYCDAPVHTSTLGTTVEYDEIKLSAIGAQSVAANEYIEGCDFTSEQVSACEGAEITYRYRITNNGEAVIPRMHVIVEPTGVDLSVVSDNLTKLSSGKLSGHVDKLVPGDTAELVFSGIMSNTEYATVKCKAMSWYPDETGEHAVGSVTTVFADLVAEDRFWPVGPPLPPTITPTALVPTPPSVGPNLTVECSHSLNGGAYTTETGSVNPNETIAYYFKITNTGDTDATNVDFTDTVPFGLMDTVDGKLVMIESKTAHWSVIRAGETVTHAFTLTVPPISRDCEWRNKAVVTCCGREFESNEVVATSTYVAPGPADVRVKIEQGTNGTEDMTYDQISVNAGDIITYRITAYNVGYMDANNVVVTDVLPAGLLMKDPDDGEWKVGGTWTGRTSLLTKSKDVVWTIQAKVPDVSATTTWTNKATVVYDGCEAGGSTSNEAVAKCIILPTPGNADIRIEALQSMKDGEPSKSDMSVQAGDQMRYTYNITNVGDDDAQNVVVETTMQDSFIYEGPRRWELGEVLAGKTVMITVDVTVPETSTSVEWINGAKVCWTGHSTWLESNALRIRIVNENPGPITQDITVDSWQALAMSQPDGESDVWTKDNLSVTSDTDEGTKLYQKFTVTNNSDDYTVKGMTLRARYPAGYGLTNPTMCHDYEDIAPGDSVTVVFEIPVVNIINTNGTYTSDNALLCDGEIVYEFSDMSVVSTASTVAPTPIVPTPTPVVPTPTPVVPTPTPEGEANLSYSFTHGSGMGSSDLDLDVAGNDEITMQLSVTNNGTGSARNVQAEIVPAPGLTVVGNGDSQDMWLEIRPGETKTMNLTVKVPESDFDRTYTSRAIVTHNGTNTEAGTLRLVQTIEKPTPTPVISTPTPTPAVKVPEMSVELFQRVNGGEYTKDNMDVNEGDAVTYKIVMSNTGEGVAQDVNLKLMLPSGLSADNESVFWWSDILAGETVTKFVNVTVPKSLSSADYDVRAHADWSLNKSGIDSNTVRSIQTIDDDTGETAGDLKIWKFIYVGATKPAADSDEWATHDVDVTSTNGQTAFFKYVIQNIGTTKLSDVALRLVLPAGFEGNSYFGPYELEPRGTATVYMKLPLDGLSNGRYGLDGTLSKNGVAVWTDRSHEVNVNVQSVVTPTPTTVPTPTPVADAKIEATRLVAVSSSGKPSTGWSASDIEVTDVSGKTAYFRYVLRNTGGKDARNVTLKATLPAGFEFAEGDGLYGPYEIKAGSQVTIDMSIPLGSLDSGTYGVNSTINHDGKFVWAGTGPNVRVSLAKPTATPEETIIPEARLEIEKLVAVSETKPDTGWSSDDIEVADASGKKAWYRFVIKNTGTGDAKNVTLNAELPAGFTFVDGNGAFGPYDIQAGSRVTIDMNIDLDGLVAGSYAVTGRATYGTQTIWSGSTPSAVVKASTRPTPVVTPKPVVTPDTTPTVKPDMTPDVTPTTTPVAGKLSVKQYVAITNDGQPDESSPEWSTGNVVARETEGYTAYFQYVFENTGDEPISNMTFKTKLPDGFTGNEEHGPYDILAHGTFKFVLSMPLDALGDGIYGIAGNAFVGGTCIWAGVSPVITVDSGTATPTPDTKGLIIRAQQSVNGGAPVETLVNVKPGDVVKYGFTVTNQGNTVARDVVLTFKVPDGMIILGQRGQDVSWTWDEIAPGEAKVAELEVQVPESAVGLKLNVKAQLSAEGVPVIESNALDAEMGGEGKPIEVIFTQNVNCPYTTNTVTANGGETAWYHVKVRNVSDGDIENVVLKGVLPAGFAVSRDLTWELGTLSAGDEKLIEFNATVTTTLGSYTSKMQVTSDAGDFESNVLSLRVVEPGSTPSVKPVVTPDVTTGPIETVEPGETDGPIETKEPTETDEPGPVETQEPVPGETVQPDTTPSVEPDITPGVEPDNTPDVRPDNTPDVRPDNTPGTRPSNTPDGPSGPTEGPQGIPGSTQEPGQQIVLPGFTGGNDGPSGGDGSGGDVAGNDSLANPNKNNPNTGVESSTPIYVVVLLGLIALAGASAIGYVVYKKKK